MLSIANALRLDNPSMLTKQIWAEIDYQGIEKKDLLARSHWYVGLKRRGKLGDYPTYVRAYARYSVSSLKRMIVQRYKTSLVRT